MRRVLAVILLSSLLTGCNAFFDFFGIDNPGLPGETGSSQLKRFESERELAT